jgi:hypothetical protein
MNKFRLAVAVLSAAFTAWCIGIWFETKQLADRVLDHVESAGLHVYLGVYHVALVPVRLAQWVWGCLKQTGDALKNIWKR